MPWAQKDDGAWTDPRLSALSDRAYRLHDNCWTYAADKLTDGRITRDEVARVAAMFGLTDPAHLVKAVNELLTWKLWTQDTTSYEMVGWLEQNRSKKRVLREQRVNREKQRRWRAKQVSQEADE